MRVYEPLNGVRALVAGANKPMYQGASVDVPCAEALKQ